MIYVPTKWIAIAPGYRQAAIRFPLDSTHWEPEYSPLLDISFKWEAREWLFANRNRAQYIIFGPNPNRWLYRNRFRIMTPWHFTKFRFTPYIDNEWFFLQDFGFNQDRLVAGLMMILRGNLSGQLAYMRRYQKLVDQWIHQKFLIRNPFTGILMKKTLGEYHYYSLPDLVGPNSRLPVSIRIMLESLMRNCDGKKVREEDVQRLAKWNPQKPDSRDVPFCVARVLLQDFTGVPLLVDLAAMRDAVARSQKNRAPRPRRSRHRPFSPSGSLGHSRCLPLQSPDRI